MAIRSNSIVKLQSKQNKNDEYNNNDNTNNDKDNIHKSNKDSKE